MIPNYSQSFPFFHLFQMKSINPIIHIQIH